MRIAVIGNYGVGNNGDEAILEGLRKIVAMSVPAATVDVMGAGSLFPLGVRSFAKSIFNWNMWLKPIRIIARADYVIVGGGGLFTDEERPFVGAFWGLQGLVASFFKPVLIIGVSIGPMSFVSRFLTKILFRRAQLVTVRDEESRMRLRRMAIEAQNTSDLAIQALPDLAEPKKGEKNFMISLRMFKNEEKKLHKKIVFLCNYLIEKYGFSILLIPFSSGANGDEKILNKIYEQISNKNKIRIQPHESNIGKLIDCFANSWGSLCMRFHAGLFSVYAGKPTWVISYMNKTKDFWRGAKNVSLLPVDFDVEDILREIGNILANGYKDTSADFAHLKTKNEDRLVQLVKTHIK